MTDFLEQFQDKEKQLSALQQKVEALNSDDRHRLILGLLKKKKLTFNKISELYVRSLEYEKEEQSDLISDLAASVVYYQSEDFRKDKNFPDPGMVFKANNAIVKTKMFKGTPYEDMLKRQLLNLKK